MNTMSGETGKKEILLHHDGQLIPEKRQFAYHEFTVPPYTTTLQVYLEGRVGGMFLAVFDPDGVRGSGTGKVACGEAILELTVRLQGNAHRTGTYLPEGLWKVLVDSEELQDHSSYSLSVWGEIDTSAFLYPWLKPGDLVRNNSVTFFSSSVTIEKDA